jgi:hypothetical protein
VITVRCRICGALVADIAVALDNPQPSEKTTE